MRGWSLSRFSNSWKRLMSALSSQAMTTDLWVRISVGKLLVKLLLNVRMIWSIVGRRTSSNSQFSMTKIKQSGRLCIQKSISIGLSQLSLQQTRMFLKLFKRSCTPQRRAHKILKKLQPNLYRKKILTYKNVYCQQLLSRLKLMDILVIGFNNRWPSPKSSLKPWLILRPGISL